jgi:hypothetical protein
MDHEAIRQARIQAARVALEAGLYSDMSLNQWTCAILEAADKAEFEATSAAALAELP